MEMGSGPAASRPDIDAIEAVIAIGGLLIGQVVVLDPERLEVRRVVRPLDPGADFGLVVEIAGLRIGRYDERHRPSVPDAASLHSA
ncbi:MAG: hypothetical protein ACRDRT_04520 [Pseudonocardiaceae bacterium]